jgi:uncharacterized protein (TIGR03437 family)
VLFGGITSAGLFQFNVVVPSGLTSGDQPLHATFAGVAAASTQSNVYVTVQ